MTDDAECAHDWQPEIESVVCSKCGGRTFPSADQLAAMVDVPTLQNAWNALTDPERDARKMAGIDALRRHRHEGPVAIVTAIADALING